jgi:hypothetical protein
VCLASPLNDVASLPAGDVACVPQPRAFQLRLKASDPYAEAPIPLFRLRLETSDQLVTFSDRCAQHSARIPISQQNGTKKRGAAQPGTGSAPINLRQLVAEQPRGYVSVRLWLALRARLRSMSH